MLYFMIFVIFIMIILQGFFAGSESALYRISRTKLRIQSQTPNRTNSMVIDLLDDSRRFIFSLLIGTNLATYFATSFATYIFIESTHEDASAEYIATLVMTPIIFVFGEVIPKNLYIQHADRMLQRLAVPLWLFHKACILSWITPSLDYISSKIAGLMANKSIVTESPVIRPRISQILQETRDEGHITVIQDDLVKKIVRLPELPVTTVMTPIHKSEMIEFNCEYIELRAKLASSKVNNLIVFDKTPERILGYVNIYQALMQKQEIGNFKKSMRELPVITAATPILEAIKLLHLKSYKIALVTRKVGSQPIGIVTVKDLLQEITGELS